MNKAKNESGVKDAPAVIVFEPVDPQAILSNYNLDAVARSPIKYADAVQSVADLLLKNLEQFENVHSDIVNKFSRLSLRLKTKSVNSLKLTDGENLLLYNRQQSLSKNIELGINDVKEQLNSFKAQAEDISARLDRINHLPNSLSELAELEKEARPSFDFLVEDAAFIINNAQRRLNFFIEHQTFVENIINRWLDWDEDYKAFKTGKREEFVGRCDSARIDQEIWEEWYSDWQSKRFMIEQRFFPLVEFALQGNLLSKDGTESTVEHVLSILETYKYDVDDFYILKRKDIFRRFAFQPDGGLQEKFEVESELLKLKEKFQRDLQTVISKCDRAEEKNFLLHWSESLFPVKANFS